MFAQKIAVSSPSSSFPQVSFLVSRSSGGKQMFGTEELHATILANISVSKKYWGTDEHGFLQAFKTRKGAARCPT